jgi:hypothetical protein
VHLSFTSLSARSAVGACTRLLVQSSVSPQRSTQQSTGSQRFWRPLKLCVSVGVCNAAKLTYTVGLILWDFVFVCFVFHCEGLTHTTGHSATKACLTARGVLVGKTVHTIFVFPLQASV